MMKDREAWCAAVHGHGLELDMHRVGYDLMTEQQQICFDYSVLKMASGVQNPSLN